MSRTLPTCSNADLKRLKVYIDKYPKMSDLSFSPFSIEQLQALLARLEAAEEVIEKCSWHSTECKVHQAWRKAAGK